MDIEKWFEEGTGMKIKELRYLSPPQLPYNIFIDETVCRGSDLMNNIIEHNLTIEHYSKDIDLKMDSKIESFFNAENKKYEKEREWLNTEKMYVTVYHLDTFLEKVRKENKNV